MENVEEYTMSTKEHFMFQEIATITDVKPYVLRFWETEFEEINPIIIDSGQKLYSKADINIILLIKELLFDEKMSIPEAKVALRQRLSQGSQNIDAISNSGNQERIELEEQEAPASYMDLTSNEITNLKNNIELENEKLSLQKELMVKRENEILKQEEKLVKAKEILNDILDKLNRIH